MELSQSYAQTNVQLYIQLLEQGWTEANLERVRSAYDFAAGLHSARFRGSGRSFLAHIVGTASLLAQVTQDPDIVLAGLLHGVYDQGDFGDGRRVMTDRKRAIVRGVAGDSVESRIAAFSEMQWRLGSPARLAERFDDLNLAERDALLMRLANELDDFIELDALYSADHADRLDRLTRDGEAMAGLAMRLDQPALANALREAKSAASRAQLPDSLRSSKRYCFDVVPSSYRRHLLAELNHRRPRIRWQLGRVRRKLFGWLPIGNGSQ